MRLLFRMAILSAVVLAAWKGWLFHEACWTAENARDPRIRHIIRQQQIEAARARGDESAVRALETWDEDLELWNREAGVTSRPTQ
jgi:hypothetical protein